jgi:hypothetical protein
LSADTIFIVRLFFMGNPAIHDRTITVSDATRLGAFRKAAIHIVTQRITS